MSKATFFDAISGLVSTLADAKDVYPDHATTLEAVWEIAGEIYGIAEAGGFAEQRENAVLREILAFDCTVFPSMEAKAIEHANKISGPLGGDPHHPDPIGILEMCEDIAKAALADHDKREMADAVFDAMLGGRGRTDTGEG